MDNYAWLIEAPGQHYLSVRETAGYQFHWTNDYNMALRFYSKDQADLVMMAVREARPVLFNFENTLTNARPVDRKSVV